MDRMRESCMPSKCIYSEHIFQKDTKRHNGKRKVCSINDFEQTGYPHEIQWNGTKINVNYIEDLNSFLKPLTSLRKHRVNVYFRRLINAHKLQNVKYKNRKKRKIRRKKPIDNAIAWQSFSLFLITHRSHH